MKKFSLLVFVMAILFLGCDENVIVNPISTEPLEHSYIVEENGKWQTVDINEAGIDVNIINNGLNDLKGSNFVIHRMSIYRYGYLVYENDVSDSYGDVEYQFYSSTKSVISMLIGCLIDDGFLPNGLNTTMGEIFPNVDYGKDAGIRKSITVEEIITMTSPLSWTDNDQMTLDTISDPITFILNRNINNSSGNWHYHSGGSHLLAEIIKTVTNKSVSEYAKERIFSKLNITTWYWWETADGCQNGGTGLYLKQRDIAKVGQLYLNGGLWNGEQLLSEEWIKKSTEKQALSYWTDYYGYHWWINSYGGFSSRGHMGQNMYVIPDLDLVVVFNSAINGAKADKELNTFMEDIVVNGCK